MSKLGDALREAAVIVDRDNLASIAFIGVGDKVWQLANAKSSDDFVADAKWLAKMIDNVVRNYDLSERGTLKGILR